MVLANPILRTAAVLIAVSFVLTLPVGVAEASDAAGCVNLLYMQYGTGVHVVAGVLGDVTLRLTSGAPQDGFTVGFIIYPQLCKVAVGVISELTSSSSSESGGPLPPTPVTPPLPEYPTIP